MRAISLANNLLARMSSKKRKIEQPGAYNEIIERLGCYCGSLEGKRVLEAGCAAVPDFLAEVDAAFALEKAVGVNLVIDETRKLSPTLRVEHGDLRKLKFQEEYFDLIISSSVFEHLHNFDIALAEMYRVLKPGGFLFSHFGPLWSGSIGHHLWYWNGSTHITYHNLTLPPFCHLLMTQHKLQEWLEVQGKTNSKEIAEYVFTSSDQNQLMFSDYERLVAESSFENIFLKGYDAPRFVNGVTAEHLSLLNRKYPADRDKFLYDGITMLLRRP